MNDLNAMLDMTSNLRVLLSGLFSLGSKFALTLLLVACLTLSVEGQDSPQVVKPRIGEKFGEIMDLEIEFVEKSNTYFESNIIETKWMAKVIAKDGQMLPKPVIIEYAADEDKIEKGVRYKVEGYEDIYSFGLPDGWDTRLNQFSYSVRHRLVFRLKATAKAK